jgi:hypothetical protein
MKAKDILLKLQGISDGLKLEMIGTTNRNMEVLKNRQLVDDLYGYWFLTKKGRKVARKLEWQGA